MIYVFERRKKILLKYSSDKFQHLPKYYLIIILNIDIKKGVDHSWGEYSEGVNILGVKSPGVNRPWG